MSPAPGAVRLRAVLDTNIYVSAFEFPKGRHAAVWRAAREGVYVLLVSPPIIRELARVLRDNFTWQEERIQIFIRRVADVSGRGLIATCTTVRAVAADPDDDRILECAVEGKADIIVSNDRHLLNLQEHAGIPIVAGVTFRRMLGLR